MQKSIVLVGFFFLFKIGFGQADLCEKSEPFCTNDTYVFPAGVNSGSGQVGPDYGCLNSTPNPAWYHMRIEVAGDLEITMFSEPARDIDFICWGPFENPVLACEGLLTADKIVDCSYSANSTEICVIPNAQVDEYYILLITNYSNQPCEISFEMTGGTGETDCGIVPPQITNNGPLCVGDTLELYASDVENADYHWTGPLGFESFLQNPTIPDVTLAHAGDYQVVITVFGSSSDPVSTTVVINSYPIPFFTFSPDSEICVAENVTFSGTSTESIMSWSWDFGDGSPGMGQNTLHSFGSDGTFQVELSVESTGGCQSDTILPILIHPLPVAGFTISPATTVCTGDQISFSATGTTNIIEWSWDFGDGTTGLGQNVTHQYTTSGQKEVVLTVINDNSCSDIVSQFVDVNLTPTVDFTMNPQPTMCSDEVLHLAGTANTPITSWNWSFGDGNTASGQVVSYQYQVFGMRTIGLQVVSDQSCPATVSHPIQVYEAPVASMSVSVGDTSCLGNIIDFSGSSPTNITQWNWDFGDLGTSTLQHVSHTYANPGHYDVTLIVVNDNDCNDTITRHLFVSDVPLADFTMSPNDTSCMGELINLDALGTPDIVDWQWNLGDGNHASGQNTTHAFATAGDFQIQLTYTNANDCPATATHFRTVVDMSALDFNLTPSPGCQNYPVDIQGVGVANFTDWIWDLGDGNTALGHDVTHTYPDAGTYDIQLNVCSEQVNKSLLINPTCTAWAGVSDSTCEDVPFTVTTATATNYSSLLWSHNSTMGGTLTGANTLTPTYQPAPGEFETIVTLTLDVTALWPCADQTSSMELFIGEGSYADAGTDEDACVGVPYDFQNSSRPPQEFNGDVINWTKVNPAIDPTGYFVDPHVEVPVYVVGDYDPAVTYPITIELNMEVLSPIRCRESDNMLLTIKNFHLGSVISGNQTICYDSVPDLLEVSAPTGVAGTYGCQWQNSTDNVLFSDIPGATSLSYQPGPLTQTTYYKNIQRSNCEVSETPVITVNVYDEMLAGDVTADEIICFNTQPLLLSATPPTGADGIYTYQWQNSADNLTFVDITGEVGLTYQPGLLTTTTYFRLMQTSGCGTVSTSVITITVWDELLPGSVSDDQIICYSTMPDPVSADPPTGGDGIYTYQWQSSTDDVTYSDISGATGLTYQPEPLTITTYYRLNQSCVCGMVTTDAIQVFVYPEFIPGTISGDQTICYNTIPGIMLTGTEPTGGDGTYFYQWQSSTDNAVFADITGANDLNYQPDALSVTTYFRLEQTSGSACGTTHTNTVTVTVYDEFLVGAVESDQIICMNSIPAPLTTIPPTGADGNYTYQWEKSTVGGIFTLIPGATDPVFQETVPLNENTEYRQFQSSMCNDGYTNTILIQVSPPPNVSITADETITCIDTDVNLFGNSTSDIIQWEWDFDDGTGYVGQNPPPHSYGVFGFYHVVLMVTDTGGCLNSDTLTIEVVESPQADFTYVVDSCHTIHFEDASTAPSGYFLVAYDWDLGDGTTQDDPIFNHAYADGGIYNVTLTVTADSSGYTCSNTVTMPVIVPNTPTIYYTWDPEPTCLMDTTFFYGASGTPITDWYWNFDDGHDTTGQYAGHVFDNPGTYDVILYITDTNLCQNSLSQQVTINPIPQVSMQIFDSPTCAQSMTTFQGTADTGIEFWYWDFGDGGISEDQNPVHSYTNGGTYTVTLTATDSAGCSATATGEIIVVPTPTADFSYSMSGCNLFAFTDNSTTPAGYQEYSWHWDFGDGFTSDVPDPVHTYATGGFFDVKLVFTSDSLGYQCSDSITKTVQAPNTPGATFTWAPNPAQAGDNIGFFATSGSTITNWAWDFADGGTATGQNATHTYTNPGDYDVSLTVTDVSGCTFETVIQVNVGGLPPVDFSWDNSCENTPIQFTTDATVTDVGAVAIYDWDFGDGTGSNNQDPLHTYLNANMYNVTLTIIDTLGYTNSVTHQVEVMPEPISMFSISSPNCENSETYFEDYSIALSGYLTTWEWDFGDGNTATINFPDDPDVSHIYPSTGTYTAMLTVTTSDGCQATSTQEVTITPSPIAQIDYDAGCMSGPISFHDVSSENGAGTIIARQWNFGDPASGSSNQSTQSDPTHLFSGPGTYEVTLSITSQSGCTDADTMEITITDAPEVDFTFTPACMHEPVSFTITDLTNLDQYFWDFGDGHTSQQPDPENTYDSPGDYQVTLTVQTTDGCTATQTQTVTVNPLPQASFEYSEPTCVGDTIFFLNLSNSPNGAIVKWEWDFGDGNTETILAPNGGNTSHVYANDQSYDVTLTVTDSDSCQNTVTRTVISVASPVAEFNWEDACFGQPTQFYDLTNNTPDIGSWYWDFGDPLSGNTNTSTYQNPTHVFSSPGDYTVTLIVTNTQGCDDTITHDLSVSDAPDVSFTMSSDTLCANTQVSFAGTSTAQISTWYWDFGDGGYALTQNADYLYNAPGSYTVTLTVTDLAGCEASTSQQIIVKDPPLANFSYRNACLGDTTYFTDESYSQLGYIAGWEWDLGDGTTANIQNPTHLYATNDDFQVTLIATDNYGCADTIRQWVKVRTRPIAKIESFVQVCDPAGQVYFFDGSEPGADGSPIQTWEWNLNEGYYSTEIDPEYIYEITDTCYQVTLTVTDRNECFSVDTMEVCVFGELQVDFVAPPVCFNQSTAFYTSYSPSRDSVASYRWNFNDDTPEIVTYHDSIVHTFTNPGIYMVNLTAVDTNGCTAYMEHEVIIDSLPTPQFSYTPGLCDTAMQFVDESRGGNGEFIQSWYWDFGDVASGDDNFSLLQNPEHWYQPNDSIYLVKLVVTDFNGCTDSVEQEVKNLSCLKAYFNIGFFGDLCHAVCAENRMSFTDSSLFESSIGHIVLWEWDFGDGTTMTFDTDIFGVRIEHKYPTGGTYVVKLKVTAETPHGQYTDEYVVHMPVSFKPTGIIGISNTCSYDTTQFYDDSFFTDAPINTWKWNFGDVSTLSDTSYLQNPKYHYPTYDSYEVQLILIDTSGCTDTTTREIIINKPPVADFSWQETCQSYQTFFMDESIADSADIQSYVWYFNDPYSDDGISDLSSPWHVFDSLGLYRIQLQVTDTNNCRDTVSKTVEIYPIPKADLRLIDNWEGRQGQVKLHNLSEGAITYFWDFDDTFTSTEDSVVHQYEYDSDSVYNLMLIATNNYGCPDTLIYPYELLFTGLYVPNAFSPHADDPNFQTFKPVGINLMEYKLEVFSSWGNLIFSSTRLENGQPAEGWDGTYKEKEMPTGTYIWRIRARFTDGTYWEGSDNGDGHVETNGTVTLIQ